MRGRDLFLRFKKPIVLLSKLCGVLPFKVRLFLLKCFRRAKGFFGLGMRYILLKTIAKKCGDNVAVYPDVYLMNPQNLILGNNVSIHPMSYIECGKSGEISIGNNVSLAHGVTLMATSHVFDDADKNIKDQGVLNGTVEISDNVWIGAKATVLINTKIAEGCIIGANAVVTKSTLKNGVYAGVPAKRIKERS